MRESHCRPRDSAWARLIEFSLDIDNRANIDAFARRFVELCGNTEARQSRWGGAYRVQPNKSLAPNPDYIRCVIVDSQCFSQFIKQLMFKSISHLAMSLRRTGNESFQLAAYEEIVRQLADSLPPAVFTI